MTPEDIDQAVSQFLAYAKGKERPLLQLLEFLSLLQSQGWTDASLREVRAKALVGLTENKNTDSR